MSPGFPSFLLCCRILKDGYYLDADTSFVRYATSGNGLTGTPESDSAQISSSLYLVVGVQSTKVLRADGGLWVKDTMDKVGS